MSLDASPCFSEASRRNTPGSRYFRNFVHQASHCVVEVDEGGLFPAFLELRTTRAQNVEENHRLAIEGVHPREIDIVLGRQIAVEIWAFKMILLTAISGSAGLETRLKLSDFITEDYFASVPFRCRRRSPHRNRGGIRGRSWLTPGIQR